MDLDRHLPEIASGDAAAFGRWLSGAEPRLRGGLRPFATSVDTEAVLQEALLRTWNVAPRVQPDGRPDALLRLAARIARNLALSELRRARVEPTEVQRLERLADQELEQRTEPDPLLRRLIHRCREALPAQPRRAIALRVDACGGVSDTELAERAGMSLNTFLQNVRRARLLLVECLARGGFAWEAP